MVETMRTRGIKEFSLLGAAATTATALTVGLCGPAMAPNASALTLNAITAGPVFWLVDTFEGNQIVIDDVPILGSVTLNLGLTDATSLALNNAINAKPFEELGARSLLALADGQGAYAAVRAYQALISSAQGNTWEGYSPLTPGSELLPNITNEVLGLIFNPTRPNGGLYARFAPIFNLFGIDPVLPSAGETPDTAPGLKLNTAILDVTTAYNMFGDFPERLNLFSLANSLMATFLPTNLLGGGQLYGVNIDDALKNIGEVLLLGLARDAPPGESFFGTYDPTDLPLLEALRLPSRIINEVFKKLNIDITLPTPLADALQPALTILVNIGYTDVQTPSEGGTYNRTFDQADVYTPFMSVPTLTPAEWAQVPGDVFRALIDGFVTEIHKIFGGGTSSASPAAATVAAAQAADTEAPEPAVEPSASGGAGGDTDPASAPGGTSASSAPSAEAQNGALPSGISTAGSRATKTPQASSPTPGTAGLRRADKAPDSSAARSGTAGPKRAAADRRVADAS